MVSDQDQGRIQSRVRRAWARGVVARGIEISELKFFSKSL